MKFCLEFKDVTQQLFYYLTQSLEDVVLFWEYLQVPEMTGLYFVIFILFKKRGMFIIYFIIFLFNF